ncbi:MAG: hypothetical protein L3J39_09850 [Verrucomicrobiales bacterium]|nr:hypothetical protein [Verrucomicrobiales bacterium]
MEKWRNGEMEKWRNGEMEKWRNGEMEKWRNGEMEMRSQGVKLFRPSAARVLKREDEGWRVSQLGSEYFFLMAPLSIVFAIIPWVLLVKFTASFAVGAVGAVPAAMLSYAYVKWAFSMFRLQRVVVNRNYITASHFGKTTKYAVENIVRIKTKEMRIVTVHLNNGESVCFMGLSGYNIFDDKTSFERILEYYEQIGEKENTQASSPRLG